jgi:hypothetical protein
MHLTPPSTQARARLALGPGPDTRPAAAMGCAARRVRPLVVAFAAALVVGGVLLVAPAAAQAGTSAVESCPNGPASGVSPIQSAAGSGWAGSSARRGGAFAGATRR